MPIPTIVPYDLPAEGDVPAPQVGWQLDARRAVLLVHDMQRYFVDFFPADREPVTKLVPNIARLRRVAAQRNVPVVYTAQPGDMSPRRRGLLRDFWGPGMNGRPEQRRIVPTLEPGPMDVVLTKWRYSAFERTDLHELLAARGRDQLVICGIYAHVGCLMTASDAFSRDVQPFMVADAVADFSLRDHLMALEWAAGKCAVTLSTDATAAALLGRRRPVR